MYPIAPKIPTKPKIELKKWKLGENSVKSAIEVFKKTHMQNSRKNS